MTQLSTPAPPQSGSAARSWWPLVAVCTGVSMLLLDVTVVNVALPDIQRELHASFDSLQWVIDAYALTLAAFQLTSGSLGDRLGRRKVFVTGIALFVAASLACGFAPSALFLDLARGVQGVGGSIMFATSLALLGATYQGRDRGTAFGIWGATTGASVALGPLLGGALTTGLSWRWIFFINLPIGAFALFVSVTKLRESANPQARRPDWLGLVTFSAALAIFVYALIRGNDEGWTSPTIVTLLVLAALFLVSFLLHEGRTRDPMLELGLFRGPAFVGAQAAAFAISGSLFSLFLYLTLYLQNIEGYSALQAGIRFLPITGLTLLVSPVAGKLSDRVPMRLLIGVSLALVGAGLLLMTFVSPTSGWAALLAGFVVAGIGSGGVNPPLGSLAVGVVSRAKAGMGSGINNTFRQVGLATGIAAFGAIFQSHVSGSLRDSLAGAPPSAPMPAGSLERLTAAVSAGQIPPGLPSPLADAARAAFVSGLDVLLVVAAAVAFLGALLALLLIRQRDIGAGAGTAVTPQSRVAGGNFTPWLPQNRA